MTEMGPYGDPAFAHFLHLDPGECWLAREKTRSLVRGLFAIPIESGSGNIKNRLEAIIVEDWICVFIHAGISIVEGDGAGKAHDAIMVSTAYYFVQCNHPGVCLDVFHLSLKELWTYPTSGVADRVIH